MLSYILIAALLAFALWFIWPVIRPTVARSPEQAGTMETEYSRDELESQLADLYTEVDVDPELRDDPHWLNEREHIWAQLNYLNMADMLNKKAMTELDKD